MQSVALSTKSVFQEVGTIEEVTTGALVVRTPSGRFEAKRAASCLLVPAVGDRVLLAVPPEGALYVLAVLERDEQAPATFSLGQEARIEADARVTLSAGETVSIAAPGALRMASKSVVLSAEEGTFAVKSLSWVATAVQLCTSTARAVIDSVESHFESISVHAVRSQRVVEQADVTRAGTVDVRAEGTAQLRGENTFVSAEKLAKVDGELIHLG